VKAIYQLQKHTQRMYAGDKYRKLKLKKLKICVLFPIQQKLLLEF